ncbi:hypothetical protein Aab01nite_72880 [Paractinoplanes abujensis]|uniref:Cell division transport system permease protein n=1 Tax=Paractinoplanes abujensis TaxID=882441 RepID=A0A7W7CUL3_9ACTN|nr:permease-like cell division protein FtsX [Actinoplanes abujensis]MBB4694966.1 cell division transport system permease protein [Actinoplanes abujensis]GID23698.1 hypothetical protein Aab01nite_72880 [Actinoplanes abujensis]
MRRLLIAVLAAFALLGPSGCSLFQDEQKDNEAKKIEKLLGEDPVFSVFLRPDVTAGQKTTIESYLGGLDGIKRVQFETRAEAYERFKDLWSDDPEFVRSVSEDALPETYRVHMTSVDAVRKVRDGTEMANIKNLPGVQDTVVACLTTDECRELLKQVPK